MTNMIQQTYNALKKIPGGHFLFSQFIGYAAPYSGTIYADIEELKDGYARISMKDRRHLRNHLKSIHAIAMMNLAELATGLAINYSLPKNARGILTHLGIDYKKKARGTLTVECFCTIPGNNSRTEYEVIAEIKDKQKNVVAVAKARWLVGPSEKKREVKAV
jgi:uncharacterized protein (TIGR00369 family)